MPKTDSDPWTEIKTHHGFPADQVISAIQKEIRRGNTENAVLLAHEMVMTSPELEEYLWHRLMVISVEDIGFGQPDAPILINSLYQMLRTFNEGAPDRELFAVHAVRYLSSCRKDRSSDEMTLWAKLASERGGALPVIPDYALDMHTADGKKMGRGLPHFLKIGAQVNPELPERDRTYRDRIMKMVGEKDGRATP